MFQGIYPPHTAWNMVRRYLHLLDPEDLPLNVYDWAIYTISLTWKISNVWCSNHEKPYYISEWLSAISGLWFSISDVHFEYHQIPSDIAYFSDIYYVSSDIYYVLNHKPDYIWCSFWTPPFHWWISQPRVPETPGGAGPRATSLESHPCLRSC